jgi:3'-phosphoadenosine 5'-phosphosulfate sulfotransferase
MNMKKIFLAAVLPLIFGSAIFAQTDKQIAAIRAEVAAINKSAAKYTKKTKSIEGISLEGAEATYFVAGKGFKKVLAKIYGETYNSTGEFYYSGEELIFAFVKFNKYDTQIGIKPPPKVVRTEEQRLYFAGGDLIRMLVGKSELKSDNDRYTELKDAITDISKKLQESYN